MGVPIAGRRVDFAVWGLQCGGVPVVGRGGVCFQQHGVGGGVPGGRVGVGFPARGVPAGKKLKLFQHGVSNARVGSGEQKWEAFPVRGFQRERGVVFSSAGGWGRFPAGLRGSCRREMATVEEKKKLNRTVPLLVAPPV